MRNTTAVLIQHQGEWLLVVDDDEDGPERVWRDFPAARIELEQEGWQIVEGPGVIRPLSEEGRHIEVMGYRLRRGIQ